MNKETLLFLQKVKESFPVFRKQEKRFFTDFSNSVKDYAVYNQKCTNKDLETRFGKPEDIVNTYYNNTHNNR